MYLLTNIFDIVWLNAGDKKLVPGAFIYHFQFSLIDPFKKMKHWKLDIIVYQVIGAGCLIEKGLELSSSPPNRSNDFRKILNLPISIS